MSNISVVSGDDQGNLIVWDITTHQTRCISLTKNSILVLKSHPIQEDVVAFGCRQGLVFIARKGKTFHKIRAHDEDIHGIDWSPKDIVHETLKCEDDDLNLPLAVSCRDKTISIWSSKTSKRLATLKLPKTKTDSSWIGE